MSLYPASIPSTLLGIPSGVDGIRRTLKEMVRLAREGSKDVGVITLARQVLRAAYVPEKDKSGEITALQHFVRDSVRYTQDPYDTEMVQTPKRTLEIQTGDCDDKATLLAALLGSIGIPPRFVAVGFNGGPYSHVLTEARLGTKWIPLETIVAGKEPGWFPPGVTRQMPAHIFR